MEVENEVFVFIPLVSHLFRLYITSSRAGGREGAFDAAAGAALLSVVDLPDLSTVNRQG